MNGNAVNAIRSLKTIETSDADAGNALLRLLGSAGTAALTDTRSAPDHWFNSAANIAFAISVDHMAPIGTDVEQACDALDVAEPLLQQVEAALGIELDPRDLLPKTEIRQHFPTALVARVSCADLTLWIALRPTAEDATQWKEKAAGLATKPETARTRVALMLTAARLTLEQAAGIAAGDLLLLARNIPAMILPIDKPQADHDDGWFDCRSGTFNAGTAFDDEDTEMTDDDREPTGASAAAFSVPITLRLPTQFIEFAVLESLAPGYVLPLSPLTQGLQVDLLVGGQRIARGEIVEMGDSFAVHIDERVSAGAVRQSPNLVTEDDA